jgi:hypothetical protein
MNEVSTCLEGMEKDETLLKRDYLQKKHFYRETPKKENFNAIFSVLILI